MWQKYKKTTIGKSPTPRNWSPDEMKIVGWCLENNIAISCMPDWKNDRDKWVIDIKISIDPHWEGSSDEWRIELTINKKIHLDPKIYKADEAHVKMYEYAKYYYDKYRK